MREVLLIFSAFLVSLPGFAMEWTTGSWLWENSDLLSIGKSHVTLTRQSRTADKRLNANGDSEILGRSGRQVSERGGRQTIREFQVKMRYERWSPMWAYGLSRNWTFMARLPLTKIRSDITESVRGNGTGFQLQSLKRDSGVQVANSGRYENTRVGRFEIRSKHRISESKIFNTNLYETLKFPTLEKTQVDFVAYPDPLPNGFGAGMGVLVNAKISRRAQLVGSTEFLYQFNDKVYGRQMSGLPTSELVERQPGGETNSRIGAELDLKEYFKVTSGYRIQAKAADEYPDALPDKIQDPQSSQKKSFYMGLAYLKGLKKSTRLNDMGFSAHLAYESLLDGINVEDSDTLSLEMHMTF